MRRDVIFDENLPDPQLLQNLLIVQLIQIYLSLYFVFQLSHGWTKPIQRLSLHQVTKTPERLSLHQEANTSTYLFDVPDKSDEDISEITSSATKIVTALPVKRQSVRLKTQLTLDYWKIT